MLRDLHAIPSASRACRPCVLIAHGFCVATGRLAGSGQSPAGPLVFGKMLLLQTARGPAPQRGPGSDVGISLTYREGTPSCHQEVKGRTSSDECLPAPGRRGSSSVES